jgi:hypothetical protein
MLWILSYTLCSGDVRKVSREKIMLASSLSGYRPITQYNNTQRQLGAIASQETPHRLESKDKLTFSGIGPAQLLYQNYSIAESEHKKTEKAEQQVQILQQQLLDSQEKLRQYQTLLGTAPLSENPFLPSTNPLPKTQGLQVHFGAEPLTLA